MGLGTDLQLCSPVGEAMTGWTRNGKCIEEQDDKGSHHICIRLPKEHNFCTVTGQPNWCQTKGACNGDPSQMCPRDHWCVCQWAFLSYVANVAANDGKRCPDTIVCEATNMEALVAYRAKAQKDANVRAALECLEKACSLQSTTG